jgi:hypothetical protein
MVELFAFVKALEQDYKLVMRGMPIEYGTQPKKLIEVAESLGWTKPTKRQKDEPNDGRPPDTTAALLDDSEQPRKRAKMGRPPNSRNIERHPTVTYISYGDSNEFKKRNRCWLASALESLYAVYSPIWLMQPGGRKNDLFSLLMSHFNSRSTWELTKSKSIRSILTRGSNSIFEAARNLHPQSFGYGLFASQDFFMEILLDTKTNSSNVLRKLFLVSQKRVFSCANHPGAAPIDNSRSTRECTAIRIRKSMFVDNEINCANLEELISQWTTNGLRGVSGLQCRLSKAQDHNRKKTRKQITAVNSCPLLQELNRLSFVDGEAPAHLYFHIDLAEILNEKDQQDFQSTISCPFKLNISGTVYTLISRGFWGGSHYWGKVLRNVNGVTAVWLHDNQQNSGIARLDNTVPGSISGAQQHTSWLIYSRQWTPEENAFADAGIASIKRDNPQVKEEGLIPFIGMSLVLNSSYHAAMPIPHDNSRPASDQLNTLAPSVVVSQACVNDEIICKEPIDLNEIAASVDSLNSLFSILTFN